MKKLLAIIILWVPLAAFALKPIMIISFVSGNTSIDRSGTDLIEYRVTNNSGQTLQNMTVIANAGLEGSAASAVTLSSSNCGTLAPNAFCTFFVSITGNEKLPNSFTLAPAVCAFNNQICSRPDGSNREDITVITQAYVTNTQTGIVDVCNVNTTNGNLTPCVTVGPTFFTPTSIALNPSLTFAYVTNFANGTVSVCPIKADGTFNPCTDALEDQEDPLFIALNPAGTIAYLVTDSSNATTVKKCGIGIDGILTCSRTGEDFSGPSSIAIHPNGKFAYVTNAGSNSVSLCSVSSGGESEGELTDCAVTGDIAFTMPSGIALNPSGTKAYITEVSFIFEAGFIVCSVNSTTGALSSCAPVDIEASNPGGVAVMLDGSRVFLTDSGLDDVISCPLNSDGGIDGVCTTVGIGFSGPMGIALN